MNILNNKRFYDKDSLPDEFLDVSYNNIRNQTIFVGAHERYGAALLAFTLEEAEAIRDHLTELIENASRDDSR